MPSKAGALSWHLARWSPLRCAVEELGTEHAACIGFNIPNNGGWACDWMNIHMESKGLRGTSLLMDPAMIDRGRLTAAIKGITSGTNDLLCAPYYVGEADRHMPNHTGRMVVFKDGGFATVQDCFEIGTAYLEPIFAQEQAFGLR
jgi:hypothetical protein